MVLHLLGSKPLTTTASSSSGSIPLDVSLTTGTENDRRFILLIATRVGVPDTEDHCELRIEEVLPDEWIVAALNTRPALPTIPASNMRGVGVAPALFRLAQQQVNGGVIRSASNNEGQGVNQFRWPDATAMWNRMVARGEATYDQNADRYTLI